MATLPQIKTQKILDLIKSLKSSLRTNNDLSFNIFVNKDNVCISYGACVRRSDYYSVVKTYEKDVNKFINLVNSNPLSKGNKLKNIQVKDYENDTEYDEYEIDFSRALNIKIGKNQEKFFKELGK